MQLEQSLRVLVGVAAFALAGHVHAQATRTWVSGVGDDANPCSRTAPCKTFAGAISKTATGGEIDTLDPGGFGAVTITKAITIANEGTGEAGVLVSGTNGIVVNAPAGSQVYLRGLQFEGLGNSPSGVLVLGGDVHIDNCIIKNFRGVPGAGINSQAGVSSRVYVSNTQILGNLIGIQIDAAAYSPVMVANTTVDRNTQFGLKGTSANAVFSLNGSRVTGSTVGISAPAPAKVQTYGNNEITNIEAGTSLTLHALQ